MFWKKDSADSTVPLQDVPSPHARRQYEALQNIDPQDAEKCASKPAVSSAAQRRFFSPNNIVTSRTKAVIATGKIERPSFRPNHDLGIEIPEATSAFKLTANFSNYSAGLYNIRWRVKLLESLKISNGLHFSVNVSYDVEPDVSGTFDVLLPSEMLIEKKSNDQWHYLELEEKLVVHPHEGVARVQAILSNDESEGLGEYSGIQIDHVEIRPISANLDDLANVSKIIVKRPTTPNFCLDPIEPRHGSQYTWPCDPSTTPVTRLSVSKGGRFIASLAVSKNAAIITVWDMSLVRTNKKDYSVDSKPSKRAANSAPPKRAAIAVVRHLGIGDLSIGISLSTSGDQVAVYQEPNIGEWADGSKVPKASFPFKIFNNPLVPRSDVVLDLVGNSIGDTNGIDASAIPHDVVALEEMIWTHDILTSFIGYCAFLPETNKEDWEKNDLNGALFGSDNMDGEGSSDSLTTNEGESVSRSMFVACNGFYLDVFEISLENKWKRIHTITLSDLIPTLSRRITIKLMMESISSNKFMWLEDGGLSCTIWNVMNGSTISCISSLENSRFKGSTFRGHSKMAISPHESIVALASIDGSLATYFTNTGMSIDARTFRGYKIEYVAFHGQDNHIFIILKDSTTFKLSARILDTYQLKSETRVNDVPIPTIGSTVLAFFNTKGLWQRGIICEADGANISCYITHRPKSPKVNKFSPTVIKGEQVDVSSPSLIDDDISYRLRTGFHRELLPEGEGMSYWVLRVEVVEENRKLNTNKLIFSFIPEPWMRATVSEFAEPGNLLSAYFTPGGLRFAVVGMQTLQLWNLPTKDNPKCSLEYFWSQPKGKSDTPSGKAAQGPGDVGDYYADITFLSIYMEAANGNAVAEIKTNDKAKKHMVYIPGTESDSGRHTALSCFRSVHLLAASYSFSIGESKKTASDLPQVTLTFEDHAEAILRFTRGHINRMISTGLYWPKKGALNQSDQTTEKDSSTNDASPSNSQPPVVTLLTLLLDESRLKATNHVFIIGLLKTGCGEWIPRDSKMLNPIKRAIDSKDEHLVETFINYCIKNAKRYHPAYMTPAIQCLNELSDRYPNILADMFRRASYVPAHNHAYVSSHAIVANRKYGDYFNFFANYYSFRLWRGSLFRKSNNINDYTRPVFSLRCQLPIRAISSSYNILSIETAVIERRSEFFPAKQEYVDEEQKRIQSKYSHRIYVCPFPKLSHFGPYRAFLDAGSARSAFTDIAGQEFFDSPAMIATLQFKWHKYGFFNWLLRFLIAFFFFIFMTIITAVQINESSLPDNPEIGSPLTPERKAEINQQIYDSIHNRYMENWRPFIIFTIVVGFLLIVYDILRFIQNSGKFIRSPFNFVHFFSHILAITGLFYILDDRPKAGHDGGQDDGPSQIWAMSFAILSLYMNMLFELRVFKQLGIFVNIILNITRKIVWLFLIFGVFLVSFTHALLHLLHTRRFRSDCIDGSCGGDYPDGYPREFSKALSVTYFFLAGRYDPISSSFENGETSFHIMMVIFFFFTSVLLLNILIALMNDAFNESRDQGQLAWLKQWSEVITDVELSYLSNGSRQNRNYFPDYIYYGANEKEAELYESKFFISNKSNLSIENRFLIDAVSVEQGATHLAQRTIMKDIQVLGKDIEKVEKNQDETVQEIDKVKELVQHTQSDLAQELAEMKKLISYLVYAGGITPESRATMPAPKSEIAAPTPIADSPAGPSDVSSSPPKVSPINHPIISTPISAPIIGSDRFEPTSPLRSKSSHTMLRRILQEKQKLSSNHTCDTNNASHPVYIQKSARTFSSDEEKDDLDDIDDEAVMTLNPEAI